MPSISGKVVGSCNKHAKENVTGKTEFALFEKGMKRKKTFLPKENQLGKSLEKMDEEFYHLYSTIEPNFQKKWTKIFRT